MFALRRKKDIPDSTAGPTAPAPSIVNKTKPVVQKLILNDTDKIQD